MAGDHGMPPGNLEDQVRQMLASGAKIQDVQDTPQQEQSNKPVVRLPPSPQRPSSVTGSVATPVANPPHSILQRPVQNPNDRPHYGSYNGQHQHPRFHNAPQIPAHHVNQRALDPSAFTGRGRGHGQYNGRPGPKLFDHRANPPPPQPTQRPADQYIIRQVQYLDDAVDQIVSIVDMPDAEREQKDQFRLALQRIIQDVCATSEKMPVVSLECFGSFQSGFATAGSDMDLVIVLRDGSAAACFSLMEDDLPRSLEKRLLELGFGARLLTRTRVPILKLCETPDEDLLQNLREERAKWDALSDEKKYPHLYPVSMEERLADPAEGAQVNVAKEVDAATTEAKHNEPREPEKANDDSVTNGAETDRKVNDGSVANGSAEQAPATEQQKRDQRDREWTRERKTGPLDFPSDGVGIQSDINFFNPLGMHNTQLLRCYSICDPRVRPVVLFVKAWAKRRKINSAYAGTLSSYGYVLMVLHYLINVVEPPVLPNLQLAWRPGPDYTRQGVTAVQVDGWTVDFWRSEDEIQHALRNNLMSPNTDSVGALLAGFFHYFSALTRPSFHFVQDCLSLRTFRGIISKEAKGWVKAVTEESDGKRVQHRYLFCIEDPFELSHNVARTVTHHGIVAIRNEFRRAHDILHSVGNGFPRDLFAEVEAADLEAAAAAAAASLRQRNNQRVEAGSSDLENAVAAAALRQRFNQHGRGASRGGRGGAPNSSHGPSSANKQAPVQNRPSPPPPQVGSEDAFPTLGAAKDQPTPKRGGHKKNADSNNSNFGEVSGDRAKAIVEEARRKKMEKHAEHTATGAAEAVLEGLD